MTENSGPKRFDPSAIDPLKVKPDSSTSEASSESSAAPNPSEAPTPKDNGTSSKSGVSPGSLAYLGSDLARVMQDEGYHPVVLFGTNNSGKTSLLMSLFATIASEPVLDTGLFLCDPILGSRTELSRQLHKEAEHSFHIKTQAFIAGEKIPK